MKLLLRNESIIFLFFLSNRKSVYTNIDRENINKLFLLEKRLTEKENQIRNILLYILYLQCIREYRCIYTFRHTVKYVNKIVKSTSSSSLLFFQENQWSHLMYFLGYSLRTADLFICGVGCGGWSLRHISSCSSSLYH